MTGGNDGNGEKVGPKSSKGGPCRIREKMPAQKGDIWRGGLTLEGVASREIMVRNSKLRTVDSHVEGPPSGRCPIVPCSGEPGLMVGVKVAKHILVSRATRRA